MLAYGENHAPPLVRLPRAGMVRRAGIWLEASHDDPLEREAAAGPLELPEPTPRPPCSVALEDVELETDKVGEVDTAERDVARAAGLGAHAACATSSSRRGAELPAALARRRARALRRPRRRRARC